MRRNWFRQDFSMTRQYIQFGSLVFDNFEMIPSASLSTNTKVTTMPYWSMHGNHTFMVQEPLLFEAQSLSMTIRLDVRKLGVEDRFLYKRFVLSHLNRKQKLWAVDGRNLIWAEAILLSISEQSNVEPWVVEFDCDFILPMGYWVEADSKSTFFEPYSLCDWNVIENIFNTQLCECRNIVYETCPSCIGDDCDFWVRENTLCYRGWDALRSVAFDCETRYRIVENLHARRRIWCDAEEYHDFSFCDRTSEQGSTVGATFTAQTTFPTHHLQLIFEGRFLNPVIRLNSTRITIRGEFEGALVIRGNLTAKIINQAGDCEIDFHDIAIVDNTSFYIQQGSNRVSIISGVCDQRICLRVDYRPITI